MLTLSEPRPIGHFELTDQHARPFESSDLRGRTSLVFFGFTNCQSVCPPTMTQLGQVARALAGEPRRFSNMLISVDGKRDTPEAMARFLGVLTEHHRPDRRAGDSGTRGH